MNTYIPRIYWKNIHETGEGILGAEIRRWHDVYNLKHFEIYKSSTKNQMVKYSQK